MRPNVQLWLAVAVIVGVFFADRVPVSVPTFAAAPSPSIFLYLAAILAAAPFVGDFAKAWWSRSKGTVNSIAKLTKSASQRAGGLAGWKMAAIAFVAGVAVSVVVMNGGFRLPDWKWPEIVNPSPSGPRRVLIVYESKGADEQFKGELVSLRKDADAGYLKSKGHVLDLLDLDAKGPDGQPSPRVTEFKTNFADLKPPVLMVIAPPSKVLSAESIPATVKATELIEKVKAKE